MLKEFEKWRIDDLPEQDLSNFKKVFLEHRVYFFGLYRYMALESISYPSINQMDIVNNFKACKIIDADEKKNYN